jgi:hypothetical protein
MAGRKPGQTSKRIAAAARRNGIAGGDHGAKGGRPAGVLPPAMMARLGSAPVGEPLKLARWFSNALALLSEARMSGIAGIDELAKEIRANASASGRVIPHDIIFEAHQAVRNDDDAMEADGGPGEFERQRDPGQPAARCEG